MTAPTASPPQVTMTSTSPKIVRSTEDGRIVVSSHLDRWAAGPVLVGTSS
jgi:hypothetical protein